MIDFFRIFVLLLHPIFLFFYRKALLQKTAKSEKLGKLEFHEPEDSALFNEEEY